MLVLSRRTNESIIINGNITVTVLEIRGDHIRLGIDAPRSVPIFRQELLPLTPHLPSHEPVVVAK